METGRFKLAAAMSADQPSGPSVAMCTMSGRFSVHNRMESLPGRKTDFSGHRNAGSGYPAFEHLPELLALRVPVRSGLSRANQLHKMTSTQESPDKAPQNHGNAVRFGRIGFGDHRVPQARQLPQNKSIGGQSRQV